MANPIEVVFQFEKAINSRSPDAICSLMALDGEFVDSLGNRIQGTEKLRAAWTGYFRMVPDYSISHTEIFAGGNTVAVFGFAQGTYVRAWAQNEGEAGVPDTRGFRVAGWEAGSRAGPAARGAGVN